MLFQVAVQKVGVLLILNNLITFTRYIETLLVKNKNNWYLSRNNATEVVIRSSMKDLSQKSESGSSFALRKITMF